MANKSKLFKSQAEDITDSMFSADVLRGRSESEEKLDKSEPVVAEKPARKPTADNEKVVTEEAESPVAKEPVVVTTEKKPAERTKRTGISSAKTKNSVKIKSMKREGDSDQETSEKMARPNVYMPEQLFSEATFAARVNGKTMAEFLNMCVEEYLERNKEALDTIRKFAMKS